MNHVDALVCEAQVRGLNEKAGELAAAMKAAAKQKSPRPAGVGTAEVFDRYCGTSCPDCASIDVAVRAVRPWDLTSEPPTRVRYHRCRACNRRFKSVEV